ncbi:hypothetical protein MalM25_08970 [Planctomycetes bacterium MalM25]|nr:hypothetical protein MalM25_08970 [Planctomycetes bacterium MalM25]
MKRPLRGWRLLLFARCEHASLAESDEWDGPVSRDRWWAARLHRLVCGPCRHEHRGMRWLRRLLDEAPEHVCGEHGSEPALSDEAAERLRRRLRETVHQDDS